MNVLELRKQLHSQIDKLDDKALEVMHNMVQIYFGSEKDSTLTKAHKDLIFFFAVLIIYSINNLL